MRISEFSLPLALGLSAALHAALLATPSAYAPKMPGEPGSSPRLIVSLPPQEHIVQQEEIQEERAEPAQVTAGPPVQVDSGPTTALVDTYLPTSRLDEKPEIIDDVPIDPPTLRAYPKGGKVVLTLWIGEKGTVDKIETERSDLAAEVVTEIRTNFYRARFRPGVASGIATKSRMRIEVSVEALPEPNSMPKTIKNGSGQLSGESKND